MEGGAETLDRRGYAGGRGLYRGTLVSRRSVRFVACAYCRRDPCAIEDFRSSAHCAPTRQLDTQTRRLPVGFALIKRKCASCLWFPEVGASTTHGRHVLSPPPFSSAVAFLSFLPVLLPDRSNLVCCSSVSSFIKAALGSFLTGIHVYCKKGHAREVSNDVIYHSRRSRNL